MNVLVAFYPPDATEVARALSSALKTRNYSHIISLSTEVSSMMVYAILLREIDGLCVMIVHVQELKQMSNQEVEDKLLQCSSIVVLATAGLFERTTKSVSVRKYLKLEQHGEGAENHPLIKQIYNLPRLLCLFKKDSKPIIALSLSGVTAPPRPAPTSLAMLESSYSASVVTSYNEVLKALADAKIPPSAPLDVTTRRSGQGAVSRNDESNLALMEKIKQLETEARGLKAENHRLLSVIAPIGMSQSSSTKRSLVNQGDLSASAPSLTRPETCDKGISIEGLRKLKEIATRLCVEGRFAEDRHFDIFYPGTTDYSKLTTTQFVSMWVKDKTVTGSRRLADCPEIIDEKFIGPPSVFVSHPWRGSLASLLEIIFDYARDKKLPPETKFWLDMVAINQHKDTIEERRVNQADVLAFKDVVKVCEGGTLVFLCDIPDDEGKSSTDNTHVSTTASRGWCLYEWDWTLALHKDTKKINFRGMMDTQETLAALGKFDVGSSICWSPLDKRRILEDMMNHHGSKVMP